MSGAHIHLIVNHFPFIGLLFSFLILIIGFVRKNESIVRVGLLIILVSGLMTVPTHFSGEEAEDVIKASPTFFHDLVEEHEDAAGYAIWAIGLTTVAALVGLYLSNKNSRIPKPVLIGILLLNLFSLTVFARTNYLGGLISHPEIRDEPGRTHP